MTGIAWFGMPYFAEYGSVVAPVPPVPDDPTEGFLGCGTYEALLLERGGGAIVAPVPWARIAWERVLDDTSTATLNADGGVEGGCAPELAVVRPWRHELAIYRDGSLAWVGPVIEPDSQPQQEAQSLQLSARDLSAWWDHRRIHSDHDYSLVPTDLATIFEDLAADAMAPDNSPGLTVATTPSGITGNVVVLASQQMIAGPKLRDIANAGVDWTVVGRAVLAGGTSVAAGDLGILTDDHFAAPPHVSLDGTAQANDWTVIGAGTGADGNAIFAHAGDAAAQALDGLLESVASVSTLQDYDSVLASAQSNLALTQAVVTVQHAVLAPNAPVEIDQLIPGALCTLALEETIIPVLGRFRLQKVSATASASDGTEQIILDFQPVGSA